MKQTFSSAASVVISDHKGSDEMWKPFIFALYFTFKD